MNISSLSSSVPTIGSSSSIQPGQISSPSDPDGDGDGRVHKPHGRGGHMHDALIEAFQSLGLTVPQGNGASSSSASAGGDSSTSGTSSATGDVKQDMRQFMHALFQAVRGEGSSANPIKTDSGSGSGDAQSSFASGLSALISQVSNGSAPAALQDAFSKLAADLQGSTSTSTSTTAGGAAASASSTSTPPTLQALLTQLQQDLGYGKSSTSSIGNSVSAQA